MALADEQDRIMRQMLARLEIDGVATVNVSDGQIFMFSRKKINELIESMDESGQDRCMVMVRIAKPGEVPEKAS